jgi:hypothetical protein
MYIKKGRKKESTKKMAQEKKVRGKIFLKKLKKGQNTHIYS